MSKVKKIQVTFPWLLYILKFLSKNILTNTSTPTSTRRLYSNERFLQSLWQKSQWHYFMLWNSPTRKITSLEGRNSWIKKCEDADNLSELGTVAVRWDVVNFFRNLKEEYYDGECLMQVMKKDCVLFINRLKANREQAEINKKRAERKRHQQNYSTTPQSHLKKVTMSPKSLKEWWRSLDRESRLLIQPESLTPLNAEIN